MSSTNTQWAIGSVFIIQNALVKETKISIQKITSAMTSKMSKVEKRVWKPWWRPERENIKSPCQTCTYLGNSKVSAKNKKKQNKGLQYSQKSLAALRLWLITISNVRIILQECIQLYYVWMCLFKMLLLTCACLLTCKMLWANLCIEMCDKFHVKCSCPRQNSGKYLVKCSCEMFVWQNRNLYYFTSSCSALRNDSIQMLWVKLLSRIFSSNRTTQLRCDVLSKFACHTTGTSLSVVEPYIPCLSTLKPSQ